MSDYVPPEVIVQILLKLPTRSLLRFTSVCKSWRCIITSPSFISSYLYKPKNQTNKLLLHSFYNEYDEPNHYSLLEVAEHKTFTIISSSKLDFPFELRFNNSVTVGSCRGIVCLWDHDGEPIVLWNPCLRKHFVLPKPTIGRKGSYDVVLGFGVAAEDHDFKVVRLVLCSGNRLSYPAQAEVFSLRTARWRRLGVDDDRLRNLKDAWCEVFVNGVVHWLACDTVGAQKILVFRVAQEVFDEIKLPSELRMEDDGNLSLYLMGESLAVSQEKKLEFGVESHDVWLMQAYGDESSWTRSYFFLLEDWDYLVALRKNGEVLVGSRHSGLCVFDLENMEKKNLGIYGSPWRFYVDDYVESLHLLREGQSEIAEE